jgi:hypothetical protein
VRKGSFKVLDAFSCRGGSRQGFVDRDAEVLSVDIVDYSSSFPPGSFVQADAVEFIAAEGRGFDLISIGAPCQWYTRGNAKWRATGQNPWPRLIGAAREAAISTGVPYVIENVADARSELVDPILLCGRMFGLHAYDTHPDALGMELILDRHRLFEFGGMPRPAQPAHPKHLQFGGIGLEGDHVYTDSAVLAAMAASGQGRRLTGKPHVAGVYGGARRDPWEAKYIRRGGYVPADLWVLQQLLGTPHIDTERELFEAIPPAYTSWVLDQITGTNYLLSA